MVTELLESDIGAEHAYMWGCDEGIVAMDIETSGLNKKEDRIASVQLYFPKRDIAFIVRNLSDNPKNLIRLLEDTSARKVFHYAGFDLAFLMRDYPRMRPRSIADTKIAIKLLDPQRLLCFDPNKEKYGHSLAALVWYYKGIRLDKNLAVSDWFSEQLSTEQLEYASSDVRYLPEILARIETELSRKHLLQVAYQVYATIPTNVELEVRGYKDIYNY